MTMEEYTDEQLYEMFQGGLQQIDRLLDHEAITPPQNYDN